MKEKTLRGIRLGRVSGRRNHEKHVRLCILLGASQLLVSLLSDLVHAVCQVFTFLLLSKAVSIGISHGRRLQVRSVT